MILFIDTHDHLITIAVKTDKDLFIKTQESEYSHSIYTMPMIKSIFDENNNNIVPEFYSEENPYDYKIVEEKLDINKIIEYCKNMKSENPHFIKANYVKKIEVEKNDK